MAIERQKHHQDLCTILEHGLASSPEVNFLVKINFQSHDLSLIFHNATTQQAFGINKNFPDYSPCTEMSSESIPPEVLNEIKSTLFSQDQTSFRSDGEIRVSYTNPVTFSPNYLRLSFNIFSHNQDQYCNFHGAVITDQAKVAEQKEWDRTHDHLTGLYNLNSLEKIVEKLNHEHRSSKRRINSLGIVFLDIDDLKRVNDTEGHASGDKVIINFSELLGREFRLEDFVIRKGGDEFLVIVPDLDRDNIEAFKEKIKNIRQQHPQIPFSFGLACLSRTYVNYQNVFNIENGVKEADENMYQDKRLRKSLTDYCI